MPTQKIRKRLIEHSYGGLMLFFAFFVGVFPMVRPLEDWPFSSAPMFANYVTAETPRYRFLFYAVDHNGKSRRIKTKRDLRYRENKLMRFFFDHVYGSVDPESPFYIQEEGTKFFEKRMSYFFHGVHRRLIQMNPQKNKGIKKIQLKIKQLDQASDPLVKHLLGVYDVETETYDHLWQPETA